MVPGHLRRSSLLALTLLAACARERANEAADPTATAADQVRRTYREADLTPAGAYVWEGAGVTFVLVDVQSTVEGVVQGRADLWAVSDSGPAAVGRSEAFPAAAEIGAYAFADLTGDGLPDLFGWLADSAGVSYPVFVPGARGGMREEIAVAAAGWRFEMDDQHPPQVLPGTERACALQLWATSGAPDGRGDGWRYLGVLPDGTLLRPAADPPTCF
jgi:hypothetical protein